MKRFLLTAILSVCVLAVSAQQGPDLHSITFEGASFENSRIDFLYQIKHHLGWEVVQSLENGDILAGKYGDYDCIAAVEYTKKYKLPVIIKMSVKCPEGLFKSAFIWACARLSKQYGDPIKVEGNPYARVWQPKFQGWEMIDAYSGLITIEKSDLGFDINVCDMVNRMVLDSGN